VKTIATAMPSVSRLKMHDCASLNLFIPSPF
jgi:hypothetical protein